MTVNTLALYGKKQTSVLHLSAVTLNRGYFCVFKRFIADIFAVASLCDFGKSKVFHTNLLLKIRFFFGIFCK